MMWDPLMQAILFPILQINSLNLINKFFDEIIELDMERDTFFNISRGRPIVAIVLHIDSEISSSPRYWR